MHSHAQKTVKYGKQYKSWKVHLEFRKYTSLACDHHRKNHWVKIVFIAEVLNNLKNINNIMKQ